MHSPIFQLFTTHYIFIHPFILSSIRRSLIHSLYLHPSFHHLIHQPTKIPLTTYAPILPYSHPSANFHSLTILYTILPSSNWWTNHSPTHYISIYPSDLPSAHPLTIHWLLTTSSSISLSSHQSAIHTFTHYTVIHPSIVSSISQPLTHSHLHQSLHSFIHQPTTHPLIHIFILSSLFQLPTHIFFHPLIL